MKNQQAANQRRKQQAETTWINRKTEIEWLYNNQEWSIQGIAKYFGVSQSAMWKIFTRLNIPRRGKENRGKKNGRYKDGTQSTLYRLMIVKDKCSECGAVEKLVIHHRNSDHQDHHLENLQVLCESCHNRLTKKSWWDKIKK